MKYDRKITSLIKEINESCEGYLGYVSSANTCAMTDRIVEKIIEKSNEIDRLHFSRFHIEKEPMDNIKNLLHLFDNKNVYEIETALLLYEFLDKDVNDISKDKCVACLGCYHRCPSKAIEYKNKKKKFRYINQRVVYKSLSKW